VSEALGLRRYSDDRGHLVAVASDTDVPFDIRRVFWIYGNTAQRPRAGHAHQMLTELIVCVSGRCVATIEDASGVRRVTLDRPDSGVLLPPLTWIDLTDFSTDCVLLVLADGDYNPEGVITDRARIRAATI